MNTKSIQKTVFKVSDFISWQRIGSLHLSPAFQRRPVWPAGAKSLLIDTVLQGIPMPIIFLREFTDLQTLEPRRQVVDGQQRLRTLISFIECGLLPDFKPDRDDFTVSKAHNAQVAGKTFRELSDSHKKALLDYEFSVHVLPTDTEDRDVLKIFARMNSTGLKLNEQELRNAEWYGYFKKAAYELAYEQLTRWREWSIFSETDIARMTEVEEASDLMILIMAGIHGKRQKLIGDYYRENDAKFPAKAEVERRFRSTMDIIEDEVGTRLSKLPFSRKALFHTLFSFYYDLCYGLGSPLTPMKAKRPPKAAPAAIEAASRRIEEGQLPEELAKVLRGATGDLGSRRKRLNFLKAQLAHAKD
jgi:hypothetical protein